MKCRHCDVTLELPLVDLGSAPPSNAYLTAEALHAPEQWFPLRVLVCGNCWLAQTEDFSRAHELFGAEYAYFSGFSDTWLAHAGQADMTPTLPRNLPASGSKFPRLRPAVQLLNQTVHLS